MMLVGAGADGGNKVRTLQHQLAVCEARLSESEQRSRIHVVGSGGSNQVVATLVHAAEHLPGLHALWLSPDEPDFDNTLNMLSSLSLRNLASYRTPGLSAMRSLVCALWDGVVLPLGGNNPSGVFGHVGAAIELAEQIERGEAEDPDDIYLAVGSSCTISGLIIGIALSRHLGLRAFASPSFTLHGIIIHHLLAAAQRHTKLHTRASWMPLTIGHSIRCTCAQLQALGGPDLEAAALKILENEGVLATERCPPCDAFVVSLRRPRPPAPPPLVYQSR